MNGETAGILRDVSTSETSTAQKAREFYNREFEGDQYTPFANPESHGALERLSEFVERNQLRGKKVVEIGCGRGAFQDLVDDYTGVDYAASAGRFIRKPFVEASATALPFEDSSFDAAWTIWVLEHVPDLEVAFKELRRVIRPGGLLYLEPAWQCRSWAAEGYPVRPYSDFNWSRKFVKASIPIRNSMLWRSLFIFPKRCGRVVSRFWRPGPTTLRYRKLEANFDTFWLADSDAVNSIDPFEALVWFTSRGDECLNFTKPTDQFLVRTGPLVFRIGKD